MHLRALPAATRQRRCPSRAAGLREVRSARRTRGAGASVARSVVVANGGDRRNVRGGPKRAESFTRGSQFGRPSAARLLPPYPPERPPDGPDAHTTHHGRAGRRGRSRGVADAHRGRGWAAHRARGASHGSTRRRGRDGHRARERGRRGDARASGRGRCARRRTSAASWRRPSPGSRRRDGGRGAWRSCCRACAHRGRTRRDGTSARARPYGSEACVLCASRCS